MTITALPSRCRLTLSDVFATSWATNLALVAGYAIAIALAAQVRVPLPGTPVPVTGQTFAVLLGAAALGPWRAGLSAVGYIGLGAAGLPWFAATSGSTAGYLVGFVVAAVVVGAGARAGADRTVPRAVGLMILGNVVIYALGSAGLTVVMGMSPSSALSAGVVPFLIGDALKVAAAAALLPMAWRRMDHLAVGSNR